MGFALGAWLLGGALRPAGMPDRCRRPLYQRVAENLGTLEAPGHPRLFPAAFRARGHPRLLLPCGSARIAGAWFAQGPEPAGGADRPRAWEGWDEGAGGRARGTRRAGGGDGREGRHGDAELGHQRWDPQGMRGDDACLRGPRRGRLEGVAARCAPIVRASMVGAAAGLQGGAAREVGRFAGRPATPKGTEQVGIFLLNPWASLREVVCQRPGEAVGKLPCSPDDAPTVCNERCEGAPGRAVRLEGLQLLPRREPQVALQRGGAGIVCGLARRDGCALARQGQRLDRAEDQQVIRVQGEDQRPLVACEAESHRVAVNPRPQGGAPRVASRGGGCSSWQHARLAEPAAGRHPSCVASAQSIPTQAAKVWCDVGVMYQLLQDVRVARRDRHADVLRRH